MFAAPGLNWPLVFDDEFNGSTLDTTKWSMYLPWSNTVSGDNRYHATNNAYASYMEPQDVVESGGMLQLSTQQGNFYSAANGAWFGYSEGMITTNSTFNYTYGYAEIRAELPTGAGNWPAFWALGNGWPPENDIMEAGPGAGINHQGLYDMSGHWQGGDLTPFAANTWHTYGLEWGPGYEKFYEDGQVTYTMTTYVPSEGMYFLLNSGVATASDANYSNSNNNTLNVDYVHVYGYNSTAGAQLVNGGFENASSPGFTNDNYGSWKIVSTNPRTGSSDLQILSSGGGGAAQEVVNGLSPSTTYTFSGYGYSTLAGSYGYLGAKWYNTTNGNLQSSNQFAQTSWGQDAATFTTGPTASDTQATLYLYLPGSSTTFSTYYDDTSLEVTPTMAAISNLSVNAGSSTTIPISVTQGGSGSNYNISASSSNTAVVKSSDLTIGGTAANPTVAVKTEPNVAGASTITLTLTDLYGGIYTQQFVVSSLTTLTLDGDIGGLVTNDTFRLVRSGTYLNLYEDNPTNTPTQQFNYSSTGMVNVNGLGGNNQLILDYSGGDPVPVNGLSFNGGTGTNTLTIENMPGGESATLKSGLLVIGSDNITISNTRNLSLDLGTGSSTLASVSPVFPSVLDLSVDSGSSLALAASSTLPAGSILNVLGTMNLQGQSETIDQLTGTGTLSTGGASCTFTVGADGGTSQFNGSITGSGSLQKSGAGSFTLTSAQTFTGLTNVTAGLLTISSTASLADTALICETAASLEVDGTIPGSAALIADGSVRFGAGTGSGILVRTVADLQIGTAGLLSLAYAANHSDRTLLIASNLSFAGPASTLDVSNNDLDLPGASLPTIAALIGQGYSQGTWTGTGITSSAAAADSTHLTALGVISNNANGSRIYGAGTALGTFDTANPGLTDVLVKFTYYGDTNLDGQVNGADYTRIDSGELAALTGWYNGDFNYDGVIDSSDYALIDNAFNIQAASLAAIAVQSPAQNRGEQKLLSNPASFATRIFSTSAVISLQDDLLPTIESSMKHKDLLDGLSAAR